LRLRARHRRGRAPVRPRAGGRARGRRRSLGGCARTVAARHEPEVRRRARPGGGRHVAGVLICDVAPRDGLQNNPTTLSPDARAELCRRLGATGLRRIEAASFVRADRVPQMAGAEEVLAGLPLKEPDPTYAALVLNARGLDRARAAGVREVHIAYPVTDAFA